MEVFKADVAIIGAGGAGLRAAIAVAEADPALTIALVSKVYPMRSHTVAAEGGAAAVTQPHDSLEQHFHDTVAGGDWLCEQDVVEYFVAQAHEEMVQMEHWGCPWSRTADGHVNVRAFGGMKIERTWFAADKTGFHMLHTLFQTSIKYPSIRRFDEHFCVDLIVDDGRVQGVVAIDIATGEFRLIEAKAVDHRHRRRGPRVPREHQRRHRHRRRHGARVPPRRAAARHGVRAVPPDLHAGHRPALHRGLPRRRRLPAEQGRLPLPAGLRPRAAPSPTPRNKAMELGPRDRLSQAFWHEKQKGRTIDGPHGAVVHLDLRHLGEKKLRERLPQIYELAVEYLGVDPAKAADPRAAGSALHDGRHHRRRQDRVAAARPVFGRRMLERRHPRRQPAGLELADRTASCSARSPVIEAARIRKNGARTATPATLGTAGRSDTRARARASSRATAAPSASPRCAREMAQEHGRRLRHLPHRRRRCRRPATSSPN